MSIPLDLQLSLDAEGVVHARWTGQDPAGNRLAAFFETELGSNPALADVILQKAEGLATGLSNRWSTTGNAFRIELTTATAEVSALFGREADEPFAVPTDAFLDLIRRWQTLDEEDAALAQDSDRQPQTRRSAMPVSTTRKARPKVPPRVTGRPTTRKSAKPPRKSRRKRRPGAD